MTQPDPLDPNVEHAPQLSDFGPMDADATILHRTESVEAEPAPGVWNEYAARIEKFGPHRQDWYVDCLEMSPWDSYCILRKGHTEGVRGADGHVRGHRHMDGGALRWPAPEPLTKGVIMLPDLTAE